MLSGLLLAASAHAWWNEDWTERTRITLDTSDKGQAIGEAVANAPLAIRLHSGNFDFLAAQAEGHDLRVLAADDKTVLPHRIERFDPINELAVLWVQLPNVLPGSDKNLVYVYAGNDKAPAVTEATPVVADAATRFLVRFDDAANAGADAVGQLKATAPVPPETNALLAGGAKLTGTALVWPAADAIKTAEGGAMTVSLWLKLDAAAAAGAGAAAGAKGSVLALGPLAVDLVDGQFNARVGNRRLSAAAAAASASGAAASALVPGTWTHLALVLTGSQARLHVNGVPVAEAAVATPEVAGELRVGEGLQGAVDQLEVANTARRTEWLTLAAAAQGSEGKLLRAARESAGEREGDGVGEHGYMGILVKHLTIDAWVVILILAAMFVLAAVVMVTKLRYILRADKDNRGFLLRFRAARTDLLQLDQSGQHVHSSLYRLYLAGLRELVKRQIGEPGAKPLSGASLDAVKASVDADLVRESHKLNAQMVWLTIAISGGPFLGLLGTVVGVMITFAAIAAAGDVNVNAIAPGIAAALLATVAGLAVAIPALFAYNYLASRIKTISADMQIFVDEFITRVAEEYGAR